MSSSPINVAVNSIIRSDAFEVSVLRELCTAIRSYRRAVFTIPQVIGMFWTATEKRLKNEPKSLARWRQVWYLHDMKAKECRLSTWPNSHNLPFGPRG